MKKALSLALALVMVLSLSVCAFATSPIESLSGSDGKDVTVTVKDLKPFGTVYNVVVEWGTLSFTYNKGTQGAWNPDTHKYGETTLKGWVTGTDAEGNVTSVANEITSSIKVTNHSNTAVTATAKFGNDSTTFDKDGVNLTIEGSGTLATADNDAYRADTDGDGKADSAPTTTFTVKATGEPSTSDAAFATITITIAAG